MDRDTFIIVIYCVVVEHDQNAGLPNGIAISVAVEEWLYNFGPYRLIYRLRFENGCLVKIGPLERGY